MRVSTVVRLGVVLIPLACGACAAAPINKPIEGGPVAIGAGTLTAARQFLEGRWNLVSFEVLPPGRAPVQLKGSGTLLYDEFSNLSMEIRVDAATAKTLESAGIPTDAGVISTKGRTVVDMEAKKLTYVLEGQPLLSAPGGPLDLKRPRYWEVEGRTLTLTTRGDDGKPVSIGRWQKLE